MHNRQLWAAGGCLYLDAPSSECVCGAQRPHRGRLGTGCLSLQIKKVVGEAQPPAAAVH